MTIQEQIEHLRFVASCPERSTLPNCGCFKIMASLRRLAAVEAAGLAIASSHLHVKGGPIKPWCVWPNVQRANGSKQKGRKEFGCEAYDAPQCSLCEAHDAVARDLNRALASAQKGE